MWVWEREKAGTEGKSYKSLFRMCHVSLFSNAGPVLGVILLFGWFLENYGKKGEPACGVLNGIPYFTLSVLSETTLSISCPRGRDLNWYRRSKMRFTVTVGKANDSYIFQTWMTQSRFTASYQSPEKPTEHWSSFSKMIQYWSRKKTPFMCRGTDIRYPGEEVIQLLQRSMAT